MAEQNPITGDYSAVADEQLDALETGPDPDLYNRILDACDLISGHPEPAQLHSSTIVTGDGRTLLVLPVVGGANRVFWSSGPLRIEAVI